MQNEMRWNITRFCILAAFHLFRKNSNCYQLQVLKILAWDTKNHLVYYLGTQDRKPGQQHMYVVKDPLNKDNGKWVWWWRWCWLFLKTNFGHFKNSLRFYTRFFFSLLSTSSRCYWMFLMAKWRPFNENNLTHDDRMEPQCITCDIDSLLWSSRRLYKNCSYFDVYLCPPSSIATEYRVEHYVLECQGPTLPLAGNPIIHPILYTIFSFVI